MNEKSARTRPATDGWSGGAGWNADAAYGELFYRRAIGELPEMESSKAVAQRLAPRLKPGDRLLDVGCGAGHYLRSLRQAASVPFTYVGADVTPLYIDLARKAFDGDSDCEFGLANVFDLPFEGRTFDLVMSNNVLLHLPSIEKPLAELCRVARRQVLVRMLVGDRSFLIKEVRTSGDEFDEAGDPREFNWYNIWSRAHVSHVLSTMQGVRDFSIQPDLNFDPDRIEAAAKENPAAGNSTRMLGGWQVNGYVLQPWCFLEIDLEP